MRYAPRDLGLLAYGKERKKSDYQGRSTNLIVMKLLLISSYNSLSEAL